MRVPVRFPVGTSYEPLMEELILRGAEEGREYGFPLCRRADGSIYSPGISVGDANSVEIGGCPSGEEIGGYHTHPRGTPRPSTSDLAVMMERRHKWECFGHLDEGFPKVTCLWSIPAIDGMGHPYREDAEEELTRFIDLLRKVEALRPPLTDEGPEFKNRTHEQPQSRKS